MHRCRALALSSPFADAARPLNDVDRNDFYGAVNT
jgi:hypothetical protein